MPQGAIRRALRTLARGEDAVLADYGDTRGSPSLRRLLLGRFAEEGIEVRATSADERLLLFATSERQARRARERAAALTGVQVPASGRGRPRQRRRAG